MPGWRVEQQATELTNAWALRALGSSQGKATGFGLELALGPVALEVGLETAGLEAGFDQTLLLILKSY